MNISSISTAVILSCAAHIGAFALFSHTKHPPVSTNELVFSSALQANLIQETKVAGETTEPTVAAIRAVENKQINKAIKANESLQDLIQQVVALKKQLAAEHTQQLALRNQFDSATAQNGLLQEAQQGLHDQLALLQFKNQLQTKKIATLQDQTAFAVQQSKTLLQEQHKAEDANSQLQAKTTNAKFQNAQASSLLKLREDQLAQTYQSVKSLQQSNSELVNQNQFLATKLSVLEVKHNTLYGQNNNLRDHLKTVTQKHSTLSTEQKALTERYLKLNEALNHAQASEISFSTQLQQSNNIVNTLSAKIEYMLSEKVTLEGKLDTLSQLNHHLKNKLVSKNSAINTIQNNHRLQLQKISTQQTKKLREMNAAVIQENSQLKIANKALQTSLESTTKNNRSLASNRAELRTKTRTLNRQLTELRASRNELDLVNVHQHVQIIKPQSDSQTASAPPTQQASESAPNTGNAEIDFKAKQVAGNPKPVYPHTAYKLGLEGRVLIDLSMSAAGTVEKVNIRDSSGSTALDSAAVRAVKKWRFYPVLHNGKAIPFTDTGHIIFKIKDS